MLFQEHIALDCPYCGKTIYQHLDWFQKTYNTCPHCTQGLTADQFAAALSSIGEAFDACIEEMVLGAPSEACGCNCDKGTCSHS